MGLLNPEERPYFLAVKYFGGPLNDLEMQTRSCHIIVSCKINNIHISGVKQTAP